MLSILTSQSNRSQLIRNVYRAVRRAVQWPTPAAMACRDGMWPRTECGLGHEIYVGYGRRVVIESDSTLRGPWHVFLSDVEATAAGDEAAPKIELTDGGVSRDDAVSVAETYMSDIALRVEEKPRVGTTRPGFPTGLEGH